MGALCIARKETLTLINVGPAFSIDFIRNAYHSTIPLRSLLLSGIRGPMQHNGTARMTGTNIDTNVMNLNPIAKGSMTQLTMKTWIFRNTREINGWSFGTIHSPSRSRSNSSSTNCSVVFSGPSSFFLFLSDLLDGSPSGATAASVTAPRYSALFLLGRAHRFRLFGDVERFAKMLKCDDFGGCLAQL